MSRFYVGQRVRVVAVPKGEDSRLIGTEAIVNELDAENECGETGLIGVAFGGEDDWCFDPHHLEPLTDPGREVVEWDTCAWKPEHLRENTHA